MNYDVTYFINKFEAIPEDKWCEHDFQNIKGQSCANGHCGMTVERYFTDQYTSEAISLQKVFSVLRITNIGCGSIVEDHFDGYSNKAAHVNNGHASEYMEFTPKQRILSALYDIKAMQESKDAGSKEEKKERIIYVSVPATITEQSKDMVLS